MKRTLLTSLPIGAAALWSSVAQAQTIDLKPLVDARVRYESVDQTDFINDANAFTARLRSGLQMSSGKWSAVIEGEGTLAFIENYNSGTNGKTNYPNIIDPQNVELNRLYVRYANSVTSVTAGRQTLELADERFVGSSNFRQNQQTFDAVRIRHAGKNGLTADISYAWSDRTINGIDSTGARQQSVSGDNVFAQLGHNTPIGTLTGFAYLVDQDEAAVQGFRLSSQTYGVRLAGSINLSKTAKLDYLASWARQSDYHRNPNDYKVDYWLGEATLTSSGVSGTVGYEVLGADKGIALTSLQTPLASLFKFQGWAGKFATTPPNGLRDLYGTIGGSWKKAGPIEVLRLSATYHRFDSDRMDMHYGNEIDILASAKLKRYTLSARYAHYRADMFAADTDKFWISLDWIL